MCSSKIWGRYKLATQKNDHRKNEKIRLDKFVVPQDVITDILILSC